MAHFYGKLQGSKGEATRVGTKNSGLSTDALSWDIGGRVHLDFNSALNTDVVSFYLTRNNGSHSQKVASFAVKEDKLALLETEFPEVLV